ncbi:hypothetical protein Tco_0516588 [Tanacetum coccineum]
MDNDTESTDDLHLLRDGPAECGDECMGLSDESPDDDSDVVDGYTVDSGAAHQRRNASLRRGALLGGKNQEPMKKSVLMNGEIAGSGEMCSGEDTSSGAAEEITGAIDRSLWTTTEVEGNNSRIITKKNNEWAVIPTLIRRIRRNSDSWDYDIICKE